MTSSPLFIRTPKVGFSNVITASNTTKTLAAGTLNRVLFESNTAYGSYLDHIRARAVGTNVASVARIFINNGGVTTDAANNSMISEITLPPTSNGTFEQSAQPDIILPLKMVLNPGWNVHVLLGTAVAAGWNFGAFGGDY